MLILTLGSVSYSQSSDSNSGNGGKKSVVSGQNDRAELISRCEAATNEVDISRRLIPQLKDALAKAETEKLLLIAKGDATEQQLALKDEEIGHLRSALSNEQKAFDESQKALEGYKKQLAKEVRKKRFYKKLAKIGVVAGAVAGAAAVLVIKK
jgi:chromosome segregation ATPase